MKDAMGELFKHFTMDLGVVYEQAKFVETI